MTQQEKLWIDGYPLMAVQFQKCINIVKMESSREQGKLYYEAHTKETKFVRASVSNSYQLSLLP